MNKIVSIEQAIENITDGCTIMIGGFICIGTPDLVIEAIVKKKVKDLTIITNDGGKEDKGVGKLIDAGCVKKLITSHIGLNPKIAELMNSNQMQVQLVPQGTLAEQIRAKGYGLGGVLTKTGLGTLVENGKEKIKIDDEEYLLEKPLSADFAIIFCDKCDEKGNGVYHGTARNFSPVMASAADTVIAYAKEIVKTGEINPDNVVTPHIFVDYIVGGNE